MKENIHLMGDVIDKINKSDFGDLAISVIFKRYNPYDISNPVTIYDSISFSNARASIDVINDFVSCDIIFPSENDEMFPIMDSLWIKYKNAIRDQNSSSITIPELEMYFASALLNGQKFLVAAHPILVVRSVQSKTNEINTITCLFDVSAITVVESEDEDFDGMAEEAFSKQTRKNQFFDIAAAGLAEDEYESLKAQSRNNK